GITVGGGERMTQRGLAGARGTGDERVEGAAPELGVELVFGLGPVAIRKRLAERHPRVPRLAVTGSKPAVCSPSTTARRSTRWPQSPRGSRLRSRPSVSPHPENA